MESTKTPAGKPTADPHRPPPSKSELMSSAKLIAGAAKSAMSHDSGKIDKAQVAGATADVLGAAKHYGKLEEKSFGKYVNKAEGYLHNYHSSHSSTTNTPSSNSSSSHHETSHSSSSTGSGYGDYIKLAHGLLKKH